MLWADRFAWSGETPTSFPGLNPVALSRTDYISGEDFADAVTPSRNWVLPGFVGSAHGVAPDKLGNRLGLNVNNPGTEQGRFTMPYFDGLWPSSGKLLIGLWHYQSYTMTFNPLMSTRRGSSPFAYLSTYTTGDLRHQVYSSSGALLLDQYEFSPWGSIPGQWQWVGMLLDLDARTSQIGAVSLEDKQGWLAPVRSFTGTPNLGSTADLDVFALPDSGYWSGGGIDEVLVAHPSAGFDFDAFIDAMERGTWARGSDTLSMLHFTLNESAVSAHSAHTLQTGAERVSWDRQPIISAPSGSVAYRSTDGGATWQTGALPNTFDGLLRWDVPLTSGQSFRGIDIVVPTSDAPTLAPIGDLTMVQGGSADVALAFTGEDTFVSWAAPESLNVSQVGALLVVEAGYQVGPVTVEVTVTDSYGRSVKRTFTVMVEEAVYDPGLPPLYPHAPITVWGEREPEAVIVDPQAAMVTKEVNGVHSFGFTIPAKHRFAGLIRNESRVTVAGETYRIRRVTTQRRGRVPMLHMYCEAHFYDLATAGQVDAREWTQTTAGDAMRIALDHTGWHVGVANVTTLRTYSTDDMSPLELLREIAKQHGGDLIFDNEAQTVSLVKQSGRDVGVAFFYGRGLTDSKRVVDTTSLITRIWARNADGLSIASVNNGKGYVENYGWTSELRSAVYDFKAGTSPFTMLSMATATLANRSKPNYSYEATVADLSATSGQELDQFDVGDRVTVVDEEMGLNETQRIVKLEYDLLRPWASKITLSAKLREMGSSDAEDAGVLTTGSTVSTFDLVPYNLLLNGRFDNDLAHWAHLGAEVVDGGGTGDRAVQFAGSGVRWIEQTVVPDNRDGYAVSFDIASRGPSGFQPDVRVEALVTYEDGSTETIELDLQ